MMPTQCELQPKKKKRPGRYGFASQDYMYIHWNKQCFLYDFMKSNFWVNEMVHDRMLDFRCNFKIVASAEG